MEKYYIFKSYLEDFISETDITENLMENTREGWEVFHIEKDVIIYRKEVDKKTREKYYREVAEEAKDLRSCFVD